MNNKIKEMNAEAKLKNKLTLIDVERAALFIEKFEVKIREMLELQSDGLCTNAFNIISDPRILKAAYLVIKSKPGMMTKGTDNETLDGISDA